MGWESIRKNYKYTSKKINLEEILIISNYYPPEKGAAANRIEQLALQLKKNNYNVKVICPLANYPQGKIHDEYKGKFYVNEVQKGISINRLWIYPSVSKNVLIRIISVFSFSLSLILKLIFSNTPKKVIIQSPPLLLSFISVLILKLKKTKIILNVSDLWPLAAIELNLLKKGSVSHKFSLYLEKFIYKNATVIIGQSNEIIEHVKSLLPNSNCHLYRNYPDHDINILELKTLHNSPIKIFYAGLLGIAQGVYEICKNIDFNKYNIELHIFGDGPEKNEIQTFLNLNPNNKIFFYGMLDRNELHQKLKTLDIALVPLKSRIYGSVPSKIFEYSTLGFPIIYFGGGEGELIINENKLGWIANVGDINSLRDIIDKISSLDKNKIEAMKKEIFNHSKITFNLDNQIQDLIKKGIF